MFFVNKIFLLIQENLSKNDFYMWLRMKCEQMRWLLLFLTCLSEIYIDYKRSSIGISTSESTVNKIAEFYINDKSIKIGNYTVIFS